MNQAIPNHVLQFGSQRAGGRQRFGAVLRSNRFTLAGAFLMAIVVPEMLHPFFAQYSWARLLTPTEPELYASIIALAAAHLCLRRVGILPSVDDKVIMLPVFIACYAMAAVILAVTNKRFGYYHLTTSLTMGLFWYYVVALLRTRFQHPRLAFVGYMAPDEELLTTHIEWVSLNRPRLPQRIMGIVFDAEQELSGEWERFFARAVLRNVPVYELGQLREMATGRVRLRARPEMVFGQLRPSQPYLRIKRLLDAILAFPAMIVAAPVVLVAALLIRLESEGPAFFVQRRVGYQGRIFSCYKLRTMRMDLPGPAHTAENDPRITPLGYTLRKWRIDELPQILNVFKGDMSWIGPRPEALELSRIYQREIAFYSYRHAVRPGITGWAAVRQGNVALTDAVTRKLEFDFYYIKYFSIWLDFLIVLMTLRTIVTGFGAR